jgi:flagellar hook-associated protein 2
VLTSNNQGSNTEFDLNNIHVSTAGTSVNNVIPGVTLAFHNTTAANETVTVKLASDKTQVSSGLQTLVSAYNNLQSQMTRQFGSTGSALNGNNILYQIRSAMSSVVQYNSGAAMGNLANLGIEIGQTGQMSFNADTFNALTDSDMSAAFTLLGSATTGIGGLQQKFNTISDPVSGSVALQTQQWTATSQRISAQITAKYTQIAALQQTWNQRLQAADAAIAGLSTQQNTLLASITGLDYVSYGYNTSTTGSKST